MRKLIGITAIAAGILLVLTPRYILPACEYEGFPHMHCSDTAHAEMIVGAVMLGIGIVALLIKSTSAAIVAGTSCLALSVASFVLPDRIGYCLSSRMPCNYGMVPATRFIAVVVGLIMTVAVATMVRKDRKKGKA